MVDSICSIITYDDDREKGRKGDAVTVIDGEMRR
jgi:hypothetical protein